MGAAGFRRARSEAQRAVRREAILSTAEAMLAEMPVAEISLNELSRRVGLAKSNVLRYFESREAVLLALLHRERQSWLTDLDGRLRTGVAPATVVADRCEQVAAAVVASVVAAPRFCELLSTSAAVLERNVSAEVAARYKTAAIADTVALGDLALRAIPELGRDVALKWAAAAAMTIGAMWTHARPSAAMLAAYEADPSLVAALPDLAEGLHELLATLLAGLLARRA